MAKMANWQRPSLRPRDSDADRDQKWRDDALCASADPETFFPTDRGAHANPGARRAKAICATCPVITQCLDWALGSPVALAGIWGGTTPEEREMLIRTTQPAVRRTYREVK